MSKGINFSATTANGREYSTPSFFFEGLTLLFIGLKLGGVVDWSWWWVLAPLWIPAGIALVFLAVILLFVSAGHRSITRKRGW